MTQQPHSVSPPTSPAEVERWATITEEALAFDGRQRFGYWADRYEPERLRVVRRGDEVVGGLYLIEAGQFHGGKRVPMVGVNAVAVAPEARGTGVGTALMHGAMRELHADRAPIAVLFPATQPVYRRAGFEQAGDFVRLRLPTAMLPRGPRDLAVERVDPRDPAQRAAIVALGREVSAREPGGLDRDDFLWLRLLEPLSFKVTLLRVREDGRTTGFLSVQQAPRGGGGLHLMNAHVRALMATTEAALRRLVTALADHDSICANVLLDGPPRSPVTALLPEYQPEVEVATRWMLRVTHAETALAMRGFPPGLTCAVTLELDDPLLDQSGRYRVEVERGQVSVRHGAAAAGEPVLRITERGLAALYTGYFTAEELARLGLADGEPEVLATATAMFGGPAPWLGEIF